MRVLVATLALLLVPPAFAQADPPPQPCRADIVGLTITVPEGFADNQHLVHPEVPTAAPDVALCSYVDVVAGELQRYFHVSVHTYYNAVQRAAFLRGDYLDGNDAATLTPASPPSLNVGVGRAYERTLENGDVHDMTVLGCADGLCYRLDVAVPVGTNRDALVEVLRGVRLDG